MSALILTNEWLGINVLFTSVMQMLMHIMQHKPYYALEVLFQIRKWSYDVLLQYDLLAYIRICYDSP